MQPSLHLFWNAADWNIFPRRAYVRSWQRTKNGWRHDNGSVCILIGDVSGKGIVGAIFMAMIKTIIREKLVLGLSPAETFEQLDSGGMGLSLIRQTASSVRYEYRDGKNLFILGFDCEKQAENHF